MSLDLVDLRHECVQVEVQIPLREPESALEQRARRDMVTAPHSGGGAGGASANSDQGTYSVIGSTPVLRGRQGQMSFELQFMGDRFSADGRVYLRAN